MRVIEEENSEFDSELGKESAEFSDVKSGFSISSSLSPFNSEVSITVSIPNKGFLSIAIYDIVGNLVRVLFANTIGAGIYTFKWSNQDISGKISPVAYTLLRAHGETGQLQLR